MNDGDIKFIDGLEAAKTRVWQLPDGLCSGWHSDLPAGVRVPMLAVIDMLAFGRAMQPDGLSKADVWRDRILSTRELLRAAASGAIVIYGQRAERWIIGTFQPVNKTLGDFGSIGAKELADDVLTISPLNPAWLAPASIAADPTLWGTPQAVNYIDLAADRELLETWFAKLSGKPITRRGAPIKYDWGAFRDETFRLLDENGDFDKSDPEWNSQTKLIGALQLWCAKKYGRDCEPSPSSIKDHLKPWLTDWYEKKISGQ